MLKITLLPVPEVLSIADLSSACSLFGSSFVVVMSGPFVFVSSVLGFSPSKAEFVLLLEILNIPRPVN